MTYRIYRLDCAATGECLYVGATKRTVEQRAQQHRAKNSRVSRLLAGRKWIASKIQTCRSAAEAARRETHWQLVLRPTLNKIRNSAGYHPGCFPTEEDLLVRHRRNRRTLKIDDRKLRTLRGKLRTNADVTDFEISGALGLPLSRVTALIEKGYIAASPRPSRVAWIHLYTITANEARRWLSGRGVAGF